MTTQPRPRNEYVPAVRPRSARQDGLRRHTPGYLEDLSDTKALYVRARARTIGRQTLVHPSRGKRLRLINLTIVQTESDGTQFCEVYFGDEGDIGARPDKAVAIVRVTDLGTGSTRSWGRGAGPAGERNEPLSVRWTYAPLTRHSVIVEYTEER